MEGPDELPAASGSGGGDDSGRIGSGGGTGSGGLCEHCGSISWLNEWKRAFGVQICFDCSRSQEQLISKGNAKQKYALTDGDLRGLGTLERDNPQFKGGAKMRLLLVRQVEEVAVEKHGGLEDIDFILQERRHAKSGPELKKKQQAADRKAAQLQARVQSMKARVSQKAPPLSRVLKRAALEEPEEI
mmetsp:Transcript_14824/g.44780  ORF Transcript_14824/g.44780 Transcript_14824/m.44780 type:complete len:187 (+) Transcript_14824:980-1540(+)|eukprot:CAMPEP_0206135978 /NCGR_PEP_ID=MMETSP1473-20131121/1212_1 /ASSEMBLY_ACC=CAM_ASM_001109 /TAXON_ID=1461547 /ORGANISM="Stichococcus sp, Strain RCC1054" /LENGTH=186 /DNA_ID=CAMNT_0053528161 /DNA_START=972 /DNA_END=1532 /DNA_ORIENTATION=+